MSRRTERDYLIWFRVEVRDQIATSPMDAARKHFPSASKIYRIGTTTGKRTLIQIIWPDGTGDQVEIRRYE